MMIGGVADMVSELRNQEDIQTFGISAIIIIAGFGFLCL